MPMRAGAGPRTRIVTSRRRAMRRRTSEFGETKVLELLLFEVRPWDSFLHYALSRGKGHVLTPLGVPPCSAAPLRSVVCCERRRARSGPINDE